MRTIVIAATFVVIAAGAAVVGARDNVALQGSDTLEQITNDILAQCPGATTNGIRYVGGGSTTGGNAMIAGTQTVSPQSRRLANNEGCSSPTTAEGLVIALDGLAIVAATPTANACGGGLAHSTTKTLSVTNAAGAPAVGCPGCEAGTNTYRLRDWRDVLALVYGGVHHDATPTKNCASDVRRSLVNSWGSLFETGCTAGTCAAGLTRAFRRGDLSGTTDTFVSLVGLGSMPLAQGVPGAAARVIDFCNSYASPAVARFGGQSDFLDGDPIRRTCGANEQACGRDGTMGLVTVVEVPANLSETANYPTQLCGFGQFRLLAPALFGGPTICPNGQAKLFNKCFQPVINNPDGTFTAECLARRFPVQGIGGAGMDGRAYNLVVKNANGTYRTDNLGRHITGAYYRVHTSATVAAGAQTCRRSSSTDQIGCLVQANPCALGFAGREATTVVPGAITGLSLRGLAPTQGNIENLVSTASTADDYPLARKLYFNSIRGFQDPLLASGELELARCMGRRGAMSAVATARGFVPVPGGVICEDFPENTACGAATNVDACADNPAGLITP